MYNDELLEVKDSILLMFSLHSFQCLAQYLIQYHLLSSGTGILGAKLMTLAFLFKLGTNREIDKGVR